MSTPDKDDFDARIEAEIHAAEWIDRLDAAHKAGCVTPALLKAFEQWQAAHPRNKDQLRARVRFLDKVRNDDGPLPWPQMREGL